MGKIVINIGDAQPLNCPNCKSKEGYQIATLQSQRYIDIYDANGAQEGGFYSDYSKVIHSSKTAYCVNCGEILHFWVKRAD